MRRMQKPQKQQVITVFKHGPKPRKMCRVLVAGHSSLEQIKMEISDGLGISTRENVILNSMGGAEVRSVYDILTDKNNIIIASFPGEFDKNVYSQRRTQLGCTKEEIPHFAPLVPPSPPHLTHQPLLKPVKSSLKTSPSQPDLHVTFRVTNIKRRKRRRSKKRRSRFSAAKGAYQRVPPPSHRLPAMSKSSTTRLPPISGGWDNSSDGRSSGSDIMQLRVGYERQMKREYNARHSNRMNKLSDESAMEVSDILYSHERQRRADHQIRLERRQKLALKHLQDQEHRLHQAYKPAEKLRSEKRFPKKLNDKVRVGRPQGSEYHQNVVNLFTNPRGKLPNSLNQHSVLPSVRKDKKQEKPSMIPIYSKARSRPDQQTKRRKEDSSKVSQIPVRAPIPSINKKTALQPEIIREVDGGSHTPRSHLSVASSLHPASSIHTATPDLIEQTDIPLSDKPVQENRTPIIPPPIEIIKEPVSTPAKRPSTPIAKPTTTSSSKVSVTSGVESLAEEAEDKKENETMQRFHTPQPNEDLGYDSPKPTPKHPKLSSYEAEDDIKMPAKLTQRDSGLADSIEPDSTESRRQSVTPDVRASSPEIITEQEREPSVSTKLDPVTEETETESPPVVEEFKFKPMLEIFKPKSETVFNNTFLLGQTLGDGNFAIVKTAIEKSSKNGVAIKIIDKEKLKGKEGMMINEIRIMRKLEHDHCVKLYDIYESEPHIYLVTELVRDGDLFDCIVKNRCFAEHVVRGMMFDMVSALDYMHSRSIVHRDIKPENILVNRVSERYRLKLGDFGLSMVVKEPIFTICGTPTYIAPEILVECGYGLEIDMWAIGVINYILLCGFPPFRSKNKDQEELFSLIMAGEFRFISPYWDKISHGAKDLISRLLQVVPDDRITAKQVLNHSWLKGRPSEE